MNSNRVCHITTVHKENDNRIFYKECVSLSKNNFEVFLLCAGAESRFKSGVNIIGFPKKTNRIQHFFKNSIYEAIKQALNIKASIYHFHDPELIFTGLFLRLCGKKVIYDIHENNPSSILSKPYLKSKLSRNLTSIMVNILEKVVAPFFSKIVTARPDISKRFSYVKPVTLKNLPILDNHKIIERPKIVKQKNVVIFVGGLAEIRGIKELINAFEEFTNTELWLLGPWASDSFRKKCESLSGWKNTNYLGVVEPYEIYNYLNQADIGIVTFLPYPNHTNTLATKPFEYMMAGLPMIMSDFPYWRDFFKDSSLYVNPYDSKDIAKVIQQLLNQPETMKKMGESAQKKVIETLNWNVEEKKLITLYNKLLQ